MKIGKALKWILAAVMALIVVNILITIFGGFHHTHPIPHHFGWGHGGHGMRGGHHYNHMGGFHFFWRLASIGFWIAVILVLIGWVTKRRKTGQVNEYPYHQMDFWDEWEKKQLNQKENE